MAGYSQEVLEQLLKKLIHDINTKIGLYPKTLAKQGKKSLYLAELTELTQTIQIAINSKSTNPLTDNQYDIYVKAVNKIGKNAEQGVGLAFYQTIDDDLKLFAKDIIDFATTDLPAFKTQFFFKQNEQEVKLKEETKLKTENTSIVSQLQQVLANQQKSEEQNQALQTQITQLSTQVKDANTQVAALKATVEEANNQITTYQENFGRLRQALTFVNLEVSDENYEKAATLFQQVQASIPQLQGPQIRKKTITGPAGSNSLAIMPANTTTTDSTATTTTSIVYLNPYSELPAQQFGIPVSEQESALGIEGLLGHWKQNSNKAFERDIIKLSQCGLSAVKFATLVSIGKLWKELLSQSANQKIDETLHATIKNVIAYLIENRNTPWKKCEETLNQQITSCSLSNFSNEELQTLKALSEDQWKSQKDYNKTLFDKIQQIEEKENQYKHASFTYKEITFLKELLDSNDKKMLSAKLVQTIAPPLLANCLNNILCFTYSDEPLSRGLYVGDPKDIATLTSLLEATDGFSGHLFPRDTATKNKLNPPASTRKPTQKSGQNSENLPNKATQTGNSQPQQNTTDKTPAHIMQ